MEIILPTKTHLNIDKKIFKKKYSSSPVIAKVRVYLLTYLDGRMEGHTNDRMRTPLCPRLIRIAYKILKLKNYPFIEMTRKH